jgi:predicted signal transduction protein with EAL and GGDEF domain
MSTKKNNKSEKVEDVNIDIADVDTTTDIINETQSDEIEAEAEAEAEATTDDGWVYIDSVGADPGRKSRVK